MQRPRWAPSPVSQAEAKYLTLVATDGDQGLRLNLRSKDTEIEGYINVDKTLGMEAFPLDYPDGSCAEIRASHIL